MVRLGVRVTVRLFAVLRERAGAEAIQLDLPADAQIADVRLAVQERFPALAALLPSAMTAVNQEYRPSGPVHDGDEIALIPPVSGG